MARCREAEAVGAYGDLGCAARVAQAYGEHPDIAVIRMHWSRAAVAGAFGGSQARQAASPRPDRNSASYADASAGEQAGDR